MRHVLVDVFDLIAIGLRAFRTVWTHGGSG